VNNHLSKRQEKSSNSIFKKTVLLIANKRKIYFSAVDV